MTTQARNKHLGRPGNGGRFAGVTRDDAEVGLVAKTRHRLLEGSQVRFDAPADPDDPSTMALVLQDGREAGSVKFLQLGGDRAPNIEITNLSIPNALARKGFATEIMDALERRFAGVPVNHVGLTDEGLAFNTARYGAAVNDGELTPIDPDDPDSADYEHQGILDGEDLWRGGWTLDGVRIPRPKL